MKRLAKTTLVVISLCAVYLASASKNQAVAAPFHTEPLVVTSGLFDGMGQEIAVVFRQEIQVSGAPWMRLRFSDYNLGAQSCLKITSLKDGSWQRLDAKSMAQWRNTSACFNGEAVTIELYAAPGEKGIFFHVGEIVIGEWSGGVVLKEQAPVSLCGTDDRVSSTDPRVGRIFTADFSPAPCAAGCTGWIVSNGAHLTAGHCTVRRWIFWNSTFPPRFATAPPNSPPPRINTP